MNRMWSEFFGSGISKTVEDFGSQGDWPSHLELLNWLAAEFMNPQFDAAEHIRGMYGTWFASLCLARRIGNRRYLLRNSMSRSGESALARQNRFRVDAESVHDLMLEISGLLVNKFGGPSVEPYQPDGYLAALNFPKRSWSASHGDDLYRRGIYTFWQRTFVHPTMTNFDAPSREECAVFRTTSNTPLQALDLLNDPTFVEASRVFGEHILQYGGKDLRSQLRWAFQQATTRQPENDELQILVDLHARVLLISRLTALKRWSFSKLVIRGFPRTSGELAAMSNVARAILNLHEVITRD